MDSLFLALLDFNEFVIKLLGTQTILNTAMPIFNFDFKVFQKGC